MALTVLPNVSVLVSIWLETLFYGIYVVVFMMAFWIICNRRGTHFSSLPVAGITVLMFCICTAHVGVNFTRLIQAFILPETKEETLKYLYDLTQPTNIAKQALWVCNNLLADSVIVWRLWTVWGNRWTVCILPVILLLSTTAFGIAVLATFSEINVRSSIFTVRFTQRATAQYAFSLCNNVVTTALIAGRIMWVTDGMKGMFDGAQRKYWRVILVVIESGAVYAFTQIIQLSFYVSKFPGIYFVADSFVQIMAIVPTMIVVVVGMGFTSTSPSLTVQGGRTTAGTGSIVFAGPPLNDRSELSIELAVGQQSSHGLTDSTLGNSHSKLQWQTTSEV
ncbi:hypothetical protein PUNSTDRAFT_139046 [Punctularia strigosozonata HHB-11173 SS5]|uniref:Uncharacterized protein n=1 Tax=Punctularia strigosozonata (strain HHB-11173) TaxID=741275 RepID=R7S0U1_PUNST|nr:uncharacterized protein PUNSTDRAFT_139046 [Punctularia strigosozonata HHB-11173 SS5]EIN04005.1 hypothetical protein PUNSTDRAFT_139046 [Punctularia strigosozonata HHB-11173 SS5]